MVAVRRFVDRADGGRRLAETVAARLREESGEEPILVLGLARGGLPVAAEVARELDAALDVLVVRKVGHPRQPEYALGAVSETGVVFPLGLDEALAAPQQERALVQATALRGGRPRQSAAGRRAVVVDDGLATGRSMAAALLSVLGDGAAGVLMAVPVAAGPGFRALAADHAACAVDVIEPPEFFAVGQFYEDFSQVEDEEVARLLAERPPPA
jgi:putative phosphoribosyl transferase